MDEVRVTDPDTGGEKGSKLPQLGAIDPKALMEVAKVAGFGATKYARYNFLKGYRWSLSYDALQRHLNQFWSGENRDAESGLPHLAHAAWHCLALLAFSLRERGTDDRPHDHVIDAPGVESPEVAHDADIYVHAMNLRQTPIQFGGVAIPTFTKEH